MLKMSIMNALYSCWQNMTQLNCSVLVNMLLFGILLYQLRSSQKNEIKTSSLDMEPKINLTQSFPSVPRPNSPLLRRHSYPVYDPHPVSKCADSESGILLPFKNASLSGSTLMIPNDGTKDTPNFKLFVAAFGLSSKQLPPKEIFKRKSIPLKDLRSVSWLPFTGKWRSRN
ncbi:hypothetical protein NEOLI_004124 [Neolecta irregularis DAH-3]|uniref:Uncharacterized protein n=1 Tax=Neolecta irregularis (strain DAH-3) TaxID=1198029 RepID=A0A1U7LQD6_NEOID|nr:hypothetical protein NEOLI_004124 [Neolecta irregularis DAH-3]|eukprot:OLL24875.1 hypothetical protein NEOLI_004124 [Neolecta irregularis DAH-3]